MVDVHLSSVTNDPSVVGGSPISSHDKTVVGIYLRQGGAVALQHLFAGIASVTIHIQPMWKKIARVSGWILVLHGNARQNLRCVEGVRLGAYQGHRCNADRHDGTSNRHLPRHVKIL